MGTIALDLTHDYVWNTTNNNPSLFSQIFFGSPKDHEKMICVLVAHFGSEWKHSRWVATSNKTGKAASKGCRIKPAAFEGKWSSIELDKLWEPV